MTDLLNCPFCGGEAWLNDYEAKYSDLPPKSRAPQCRSCGASLGYLTTPAKAIAAWNRRPHAPVSRPGDGVEWENMEASAWRWLSRLYPNDAPADLAYDANEMVDAFVAGAGEASRMAKALWRIAEERQYRAGYCQTDFAVEPALTAEEAQAVAREALSPIGPALTPPAEPVSRPGDGVEGEKRKRIDYGKPGDPSGCYFPKEWRLLSRAREYVADALDAHEHSDGRDLINEIDAALTPPAEPVSRPAGEGEREAVARIILEHVSGNDPDELIHYPWQKSWEEPSRPRWTQFEEAADAIIALLSPAAPDAGGGLDWTPPFDREYLARRVREAWVRWAEQQPNPKASWLAPYDDLSEPDREADRQIGEHIQSIVANALEERAALASLAVPLALQPGGER